MKIKKCKLIIALGVLGFISNGKLLGIESSFAQVKVTPEMIRQVACEELTEFVGNGDISKKIEESHKSMNNNKINTAKLDLDKVLKEFNSSLSSIDVKSNDVKNKSSKLLSSTNQKVVSISKSLGFNITNKGFNSINSVNKLSKDLIEKSSISGAEDAISVFDFKPYMVDMKLSKANSLFLSFVRFFSEDKRILGKIEKDPENTLKYLNEYAYGISLISNISAKENQELLSDNYLKVSTKEFTDRIVKDCPEQE